MEKQNTARLSASELRTINESEIIAKLKAIVAEWEAKHGKIPTLTDL